MQYSLDTYGEVAQLPQASHNLSTHVERIRQLEEELQALAYAVSHDFRAPLRSIDGFSQALLEDYGAQLDADGRHYLERVRAGSQSLSAMIDDLLQLSRLGQKELQPETIDLSAMGDSLCKQLQGLSPEQQAQIDIQPGLTAYADRVLVEKLLQHLFGNAFKFTASKPEARIRFLAAEHSPDGMTAFCVADNGVGLDMKYAEKLFVPFQRLHVDDTTPGRGIGLATVRRIAHRHGGRSWLKGAPDEGLQVYFTLPAGSASSSSGKSES